MNDFAGVVVFVGVWGAGLRRLVGWEVENLTGLGDLSGLLPEAKPQAEE